MVLLFNNKANLSNKILEIEKIIISIFLIININF